MGRVARRFAIFGTAAGAVVSIFGYFFKGFDYGLIGAIAAGSLLGILALALAYEPLERGGERKHKGL